MKEILISLFLAAFAAHIIYNITKRYLEHRDDAAFGRRHRCKPPPELTYRWPLGIDRIKELWDSNSEGRLLAFLCSIAEDYEPRSILSQYLLLGPRAFRILHPSNLESVLSTNFTALTLDTTAALLLGQSVYSLRANIDQDNENKLFAESVAIAQEGLAKRFRIAPWHFLYNPPKVILRNESYKTRRTLSEKKRMGL
ncbi:hypothetical protein V500_00983 [Pseudogymnoascus sp. VKM F-4518 (FW-2643)]|nr:hypothetical protein V500_00983 [Pseudogymnoascus sp. VKM F-4518 (FW-2643)]